MNTFGSTQQNCWHGADLGVDHASKRSERPPGEGNGGDGEDPDVVVELAPARGRSALRR